MTITSIGGQQIGRPELTKAIEDIAAKAKKQLAETGNLVGFEADYKNESSDGVITLSISAMASSLYDKSASQDDVILAYKLDAANTLGSSGGSGSTLTIKSHKDIDAFAQSLEATTEQTPFSQGWDGPPDEIAAAFGDGTAMLDPTAPAAAVTADAPNSRIEALRRQKESTARLVDTLKAFLDGLKGSAKDSAAPPAKQASDSSGSDQSATKKLFAALDVRV